MKRCSCLEGGRSGFPNNFCQFPYCIFLLGTPPFQNSCEGNISLRALEEVEALSYESSSGLPPNSPYSLDPLPLSSHPPPVSSLLYPISSPFSHSPHTPPFLPFLSPLYFIHSTPISHPLLDPPFPPLFPLLSATIFRTCCANVRLYVAYTKTHVPIDRFAFSAVRRVRPKR